MKRTKHTLAGYRTNEVLNECMQILENECPPEFKSSSGGQVAIDKKTSGITIDSLADLRRRLKIAKDNYRIAQGRLEATKLTAYTCEDICAARWTPSRQK